MDVFKFGNRQKSGGAKSGEYGGWGRISSFEDIADAITAVEEWFDAQSDTFYS